MAAVGWPARHWGLPLVLVFHCLLVSPSSSFVVLVVLSPTAPARWRRRRHGGGRRLGAARRSDFGRRSSGSTCQTSATLTLSCRLMRSRYVCRRGGWWWCLWCLQTRAIPGVLRRAPVDGNAPRRHWGRRWRTPLEDHPLTDLTETIWMRFAPPGGILVTPSALTPPSNGGRPMLACRHVRGRVIFSFLLDFVACARWSWARRQANFNWKDVLRVAGVSA